MSINRIDKWWDSRSMEYYTALKMNESQLAIA